MGHSDKAAKSGEDQQGHGNLSLLTKVDKLRELIGKDIALPRLVVVGDQSSGKSSVLESLTGFAFPRDAELCTRYATQITCRREAVETISVSIIANQEASPKSRARVQDFHRTLTELSPEGLKQLFKDANDAMGISTGSNTLGPDGSRLPAFSQHTLKIEKLGRNEEHFTVIDVPGIFRQETEGLTTESDIRLVMDMVKGYMQNDRTIILAIIPSNVDPATQEILKLAKRVDPTMTRTMAILTKPDLTIEQATQQIAINHVMGRRGELTLGYYIVKNRGPDEAGKTLAEGQRDEEEFFSRAPWNALARTGRAGIDHLKLRVRELLTDLIRREFPKLKSEILKELGVIKTQYAEMGPSRNDQHTQRAYLSGICEAFQSRVRAGRTADYAGHEILDHPDLRLITRVVAASECYSKVMSVNGHTRSFRRNDDKDDDDSIHEDHNDEKRKKDSDTTISNRALSVSDRYGVEINGAIGDYPELEDILDGPEGLAINTGAFGIMEYIKDLFESSRGQDLGTFNGRLIGILFKEQSKKWEEITLEYMSVVIYRVHRFVSEMLGSVCLDPKVREELWDNYLLEKLMKSYHEAISHATFLLNVERDGSALTLNPSFSNQLCQLHGERLVEEVRELDTDTKNWGRTSGNIIINASQLQNLVTNRPNSTRICEKLHDVLLSYYELARNRFVDVVYQQAVNRCLLFGEKSPLEIFNMQMVLDLNEEQLETIAGEDLLVKMRRDKLQRDMANFEAAVKVLKGGR